MLKQLATVTEDNFQNELELEKTILEDEGELVEK